MEYTIITFDQVLPWAWGLLLFAFFVWLVFIWHHPRSFHEQLCLMLNAHVKHPPKEIVELFSKRKKVPCSFYKLSVSEYPGAEETFMLFIGSNYEEHVFVKRSGEWYLDF